MMDTLLKYILTFVSILRNNIHMVFVHMMIIGINITAAAYLSLLRQRAKPRPIKPAWFKRSLTAAKRKVSVNAKGMCTFKQPPELPKCQATDDDEGETLDEIDSLSSNSSERRMANTEECHVEHGHNQKFKANIVDRIHCHQNFSRCFARRARLLKAKDQNGKELTESRKNGLQVHKQLIRSSSHRKVSKDLNSSDISVIKRPTRSENQHSQSISSLRDQRCNFRASSQRLTKGSLFMVPSGRRNLLKSRHTKQKMTNACNGDHQVCQQRFDDQSDSSWTSKQDSCVWFITDHRSGLNTFSERQSKFQSADPRVARLAAEIHRQEMMNEIIKLEALSLQKNVACKSGLGENGSLAKMMENSAQATHQTSSSQLRQKENIHRPQRVFKYGNSHLQRSHSFLTGRSLRRLGAQVPISEAQAKQVETQATGRSAIKANTQNATKRHTSYFGHVTDQPFLNEQSMWSRMNPTRSLNKGCFFSDSTVKRYSPAPRVSQQPITLDQEDKQRQGKILKHGKSGMEDERQQESRRPPSIPSYKISESETCLAVSLPASQLNDERPVWITSPSFIPQNTHSQSHVNDRIGEVQKQIGIEVAKTIHSLLFDTDISSTHSTSKAHEKSLRNGDEHSECVTKSRSCNDKYKPFQMTKEKRIGLPFYDKVTSKLNIYDNLTTAPSRFTKQTKYLEQQSQNNSVSRKCQLQRQCHWFGHNSRPTKNSRDFKERYTRGNIRIGAINRCRFQDGKSKIDRSDPSKRNKGTELQEQSTSKDQSGFRPSSCRFNDTGNMERAEDEDLPCPEQCTTDLVSSSGISRAIPGYEIRCNKNFHDLRKSMSFHCLSYVADSTATSSAVPALPSDGISRATGNTPMKYVNAENECNLVEVNSNLDAKCVQIANSEDQLECLSLDQQSLLSCADSGPSREVQDTGSYNLLIDQWYDDISSTSSDGKGQIFFWPAAHS